MDRFLFSSLVRRRAAAAGAACLLALLPPPSAAAGVGAQEPPTDRIIVRFRAPPAVRGAAAIAREGRGRVDALAARRALPLHYLRPMYNGMHTVALGRMMGGAELGALLARVAADPAVESALPDRIKRPHSAVPTYARYGYNNGTGLVTQQWYLLPPDGTFVSAIDAQDAWPLVAGKTGAAVAVLDTGALTAHPDFALAGAGPQFLAGTRFLANSYNMVGPDVYASCTTASPCPTSTTYYVAGGAAHARDLVNATAPANLDPTDPGDFISPQDLTEKIFIDSKCGRQVVDSTGAVVGYAPQPSDWHGTAVAGIVGASGTLANGVSGISPNAPLQMVRVLGKCVGYDSDIVDGISYAANLPSLFSDALPPNPSPARVINLSLGGPSGGQGCSSLYGPLILQLRAMGIVVVASAGNDGLLVADTEPANCPGVVAVAGLRHAGTKTTYSNLGPQITLSAPSGNCGVSYDGTPAGGPCLYPIVSTGNAGVDVAAGMDWVDGATQVVYPAGAAAFYQPAVGTSFAAPMVAGTIALMLAANPALSSDQVIAALKQSARPFPAPSAALVSCDSSAAISTLGVECNCTPTSCGSGMLDTYQAVTLAMHPSSIVLPTLPSGGGGAMPWWLLLLAGLRRRPPAAAKGSATTPDLSDRPGACRNLRATVDGPATVLPEERP